MNKAYWFLIMFVILFGNSVLADSVTGTIHMIEPISSQNLLYIHLTGKPVFNGGGCSSEFAVHVLDDTAFKNFTYPLILMAKATNQPAVVTVNGCQGVYPIITTVEFSPRE